MTKESTRHALHPKRFFVDVWDSIDAQRDATDARASRERAVLALVVATLALVFMEYVGGLRAMRALIEWYEGPVSEGLGLEARLRADGMWEFAKLAHWCAVRVLGFFVVPAIYLRFRGESLRSQNLGTKGLGEHAWIYAVAYACVLACVVVVSFTEEFSTYYPFYDHANRSVADLVGWELMYFAQFFALEFFFRGFLLESCRASLGSLAIFVSAIPYVMIHFGKPVAETIGALLAGIFLGTLAMRTRSIWLGFAIHVSVALSMDLAALLQRGALPTSLTPPGIGP